MNRVYDRYWKKPTLTKSLFTLPPLPITDERQCQKAFGMITSTFVFTSISPVFQSSSTHGQRIQLVITTSELAEESGLASLGVGIDVVPLPHDGGKGSPGGFPDPLFVLDGEGDLGVGEGRVEFLEMTGEVVSSSNANGALGRWTGVGRRSLAVLDAGYVAHDADDLR